MKCQKCTKPATFHITDIVEKGKHREFHFCDEHARQHLAPPDETSEPPISELAKKLIGGTSGTIREPSPADKQVCPICQITFLEFRNSGRLGCPYDYEVFRDELMPLRNELKRAVAAEDYEAAARLRDKIKGIELEQGRS
jgi:protein arginine kinase activator